MDSIQNSEVSPSNPIHLPQANVASNSIDSTTMTELNEFSRKRARMQSEEYDSELFAPLPVAPDDHSDTHPGESDSVSDDGSDPHLEGSNSVNVNERPTKRARLDVVSHVRGGWSAAEKEAVKRSEDEVQIKMEKWKGKLAKKHNAIAKAIVQNAFAVNTPQTWSGRTFNGGDATPEKLRATGNMGQDIDGRGAKVKNLTIDGIGERWNTYKNDALRIVKFLSKIEGFEKWGKARKMKVRAKILEDITTKKTEELRANGF